MKNARLKAGLTQDKACAAVKCSQGTLVELESTAMTSGLVASFAAVYRVPALWLANGPGFEVPSETTTTESGGVHHIGALETDSFHAPILALGSFQMDGNAPPEFFRTRLEDDAMAPDYPRGVEVLWQTTREPRPGRLVLVVDKHRRAHVRRYVQGKEPGSWTATAINQAYASLQSLEDGLQVVAVLKGVLEAED
jgi:Peptidase S24-like